jgi:acyl-homoserine-lactone acylase
MIYAQAEDDFNRIETNYLNSIGRLAETEGEKAIWQDLRMKLFVDPDSMRAAYSRSPVWLKRLMAAWADGLNYYLHTHPEVRPRVLSRFEPWMAPQARQQDSPVPTGSQSRRRTRSITGRFSSSTRTPRFSFAPSCR